MKRDLYSFIKKTQVTAWIVDFIVFQQNTIFFLLSSVYVILRHEQREKYGTILLYFGVCNQVFANLFLSRESAVHLSYVSHARLVFWQTSVRVLILGLITVASIILSMAFHWRFIIAELLYSTLIMVTIAGQTVEQISGGGIRSHNYALAAVMGSASFFIYIWNELLCMGVIVALIMFSLVTLRRQCALVNIQDNRTPSATMFTLPKIALWIVTLGSSEYDRYLVARGGKSVEGVSLGFFGSLINLPLALASSVGPRLMMRPFGNSENLIIVGGGLLYLAAILSIGYHVLSPIVFILLLGSAVRIFSHLISNKMYYVIMSRNVVVATMLSTLSSGIAAGTTILILARDYYAAASVKALAGVIFLVVTAVVFLHMKGSYVDD